MKYILIYLGLSAIGAVLIYLRTKPNKKAIDKLNKKKFDAVIKEANEKLKGVKYEEHPISNTVISKK